jgi:hypothetical protein
MMVKELLSAETAITPHCIDGAFAGPLGGA